MRSTQNAAGRSSTAGPRVHPIPASRAHPSRGRPAAPSARSKGDRREAAVRKLHAEAGWLVESRPTRPRPVYDKRARKARIIYVPTDYFGVFDAVAVKPEQTKWWDVTEKSHAAQAREAIRAIADKFVARTSVGVLLEVWAYTRGVKEFAVYGLDPASRSFEPIPQAEALEG